jgi:transcription elongation factor GreA
MTDNTPVAIRPATLGAALREYLETLKPEQRKLSYGHVLRFVQTQGEAYSTADLRESRVEMFAETYIKATDPAAAEKVEALKAWFAFLKKKQYTDKNFGTVVRVRRAPGRGPAGSASAIRVDEGALDMTAEGLAALQREHQELTSQREGLVSAISLAREDKDFRENAPLDAAREALAFNEQRRKQIETALKRARVAEGSADDRAGVGSQVTVTRVDSGQAFTYRLVGAREANAREMKISVESPVGKKLLGSRPGDDVTVEAPNGQISYRVDAVIHG